MLASSLNDTAQRIVRRNVYRGHDNVITIRADRLRYDSHKSVGPLKWSLVDKARVAIRSYAEYLDWLSDVTANTGTDGYTPPAEPAFSVLHESTNLSGGVFNIETSQVEDGAIALRLGLATTQPDVGDYDVRLVAWERGGDLSPTTVLHERREDVRLVISFLDS